MRVHNIIFPGFFIPSFIALAACGGSSAPVPTDADAAASTDAPVPDAGAPDAMSVCPGMLVFTGEYVDWDSTNTDFLGIGGATLSEVGNDQNTVTTAPNGRGTLCLASTGASQVAFVQPDYLPLRYTVWPEAARFGPFTMRGLTPARADGAEDVDGLFPQLGLTRDPARAQVLVAVHAPAAGMPMGVPAVGAIVATPSANDGAFTADSAGIYVSGNTITHDFFVLIANVDPGTGTAPLTIMAPAGMTCAAPEELFVQAGEIAAATVACQYQ